MVFSIPLPMYVYVGLSIMNFMRFYSVRKISTMKQRKSQPTKILSSLIHARMLRSSTFIFAHQRMENA